MSRKSYGHLEKTYTRQVAFGDTKLAVHCDEYFNMVYVAAVPKKGGVQNRVILGYMEYATLAAAHNSYRKITSFAKAMAWCSRRYQHYSKR